MVRPANANVHEGLLLQLYKPSGCTEPQGKTAVSNMRDSSIIISAYQKLDTLIMTFFNDLQELLALLISGLVSFFNPYCIFCSQIYSNSFE